MKKIIIVVLMLVAMTIGLVACKDMRVKAADNGVSVNVPTEMDIVFNEDGTASVSDMYLENDSLVPVELENVKITEFNGWQVVPKDTEILVNTKKLSIGMGKTELSAGNNEINKEVAEKAKYDFDVNVKHGAWTEAKSSEKALELEVEYKIGTKEFELSFDGNGSDDKVSSMQVKNGESITLPTPVRKKYQFLGWKDKEGNLHNETFTMPIGDVSLTAQWQWTEAYALYSNVDKSLTFVRSATPIQAGSVYRGITVTAVYTGIEETDYNDPLQIPWIWAGNSYGSDVQKVKALDYIQPKSTAYWFFCMRYATSLELANLDMSRVTNMISMFSSVADEVTGTFTLTGIGQWDVSNVELMGTSFRNLASHAKVVTIDDISHWDTSSATDMLFMFVDAGASANWSLDCSNWNVNKVIEHEGFNLRVENKVKEPKWVR